MARPDAKPLLRLDRVDAGYGERPVLRGVSLEIRRGEIVSVLGRNGVGRTTLLKAVMGLAESSGSIRFKGRQLVGRQPFQNARAGLGYVPEGREVFARLTVEQNLELGRKSAHIQPPVGTQPQDRFASQTTPSRWSLEDMYRMFPPLLERRRTVAGVLSGGEQQMLALCRSLMGNPELMLIDEPTEGLAPSLVEQVGHFIAALPERGVSVLLVEQKAGLAMAVSHRCLVLGRGAVVFDGSPAQLQADEALRREWLEV